MLNHELVSYNPKFFWMLARSKGYRLLYMNVAAGTSYYTLPDNIADSVSPFEPDIEVRRHDLRVADTLVVAILQQSVRHPLCRAHRRPRPARERTTGC
jgi:hypothetical protein